MDKQWDLYLEQVEKHLKPLPVSERVDIVQEIKSQILELQQAGKTDREILERLGDARSWRGPIWGPDYRKAVFQLGACAGFVRLL